MTNSNRKGKSPAKTLNAVSRIYMIVFMVLIYLPVLGMICFSFNDSRANVAWQGFTTKWYEKLFADGDLWEIFFVTVFIALMVTLLATVIGTLGAVGLTRYRYKGRKLVMTLLYFPIVIPEIVLAVAMLLLFNFNGIPLGPGPIIIGNTTMVLPYVYITVKARLAGRDPSIEEAALDLGADRMYTFFHITLPSIWPGVMSGAFLSLSLVLDELIITSFLADAGTVTLPMKVYSMVKKGINPEINALSTIVLLLTGAGMAVFLLVDAAREQAKARRNAGVHMEVPAEEE